MSTLTEDLPKAVVLEWRKFANSDSFQRGLDWLLHNRAEIAGETDLQLVRAAAYFKGYKAAIIDVQDTLTALPKKVVDLDEPGLENTSSRE